MQIERWSLIYLLFLFTTLFSSQSTYSQPCRFASKFFCGLTLSKDRAYTLTQIKNSRLFQRYDSESKSQTNASNALILNTYSDHSFYTYYGKLIDKCPCETDMTYDSTTIELSFGIISTQSLQGKESSYSGSYNILKMNHYTSDSIQAVNRFEYYSGLLSKKKKRVFYSYSYSDHPEKNTVARSCEFINSSHQLERLNILLTNTGDHNYCLSLEWEKNGNF